MAGSEQGAHGRIVLSPRKRLVAGGGAEELEQLVKRLFREGSRHLVLDMRDVEQLDSAGVRALVRGHTTAQRVEGTFRLVGVHPRVREVLQLSRLDAVLSIYDTLDAAKKQPWPWQITGLIAAATVIATVLVLLGSRPDFTSGEFLLTSGRTTEAVASAEGTGATALAPSPLSHGFTELLALVSAAMIGFVVTAVHKTQQHDRTMQRSMEQAQILLCVSGAMMMVIIGDSLARAFGIAGAAGIIRFRTPVEDPKDVTILFLLMGLGMACGMGAFSVAGLGMLFLCGALVVLDRVVPTRPRTMLVEIAATTRQFPVAHVVGVFAQHGVTAEPREVALEENAVITYHTTLPLSVSIEDINASLVGDGSHQVKSVAWEAPKKGF